ncbi:hypothetical protein HLB10_03670 [Cellulomonas fimi]|uniref:hypothetical protein n=1 Tax=Cellulomonas fimi TaxID=1708 RepID=UPI0002D2D034|nr:hypothetical protein [Cellulomonas fimi]NNH06196.1 hypothetical protein [Cellulomonas fimi]
MRHPSGGRRAASRSTLPDPVVLAAQDDLLAALTSDGRAQLTHLLARLAGARLPDDPTAPVRTS